MGGNEGGSEGRRVRVFNNKWCVLRMFTHSHNHSYSGTSEQGTLWGQ